MEPETSPTLTGQTINDCWNRIGVRGSADCPELERYVHCRNCPVYSSAAEVLLDRDLPIEYRRGWATHFARPKPAAELETCSVLVFRLGAEWLALSISAFQEVAEMRPIHSLPHRRGRVVLGLANVRGELLICVSVNQVLGIEHGSWETRPSGRVRQRLLVARSEAGRLVFPVDEVHGTHRFSHTALKEAPATVAKAVGAYTRGVFSWRQKTVGWLDEGQLFTTLNRSLV